MVVKEIDMRNDGFEIYACFGSEKIYEKSVQVAHDIFPNRKYLGIGPKFFEIYISGSKNGIIVDTQNLEIKVLKDCNTKSAFKLYHKFRENNLNYKIVREFE